MRYSRGFPFHRHLYRALLLLSVAAGMLGWYRPLNSLSGFPKFLLAVVGGVLFLVGGYHLLRVTYRAMYTNRIVLPRLPGQAFHWAKNTFKLVRASFGRRTTESVSAQHLSRCESCSVRNQLGVYRVTREETLFAGIPVKVHRADITCRCEYCDNWLSTYEEPDDPRLIRQL